MIGGIVFLVSPLGRWAAQFVGLEIDTQNAYEAFGQFEWTRAGSEPTDPMKAAELALEAESLGLTIAESKRIHAPGTLVTLEYTTLGAESEELDRWQSRAIIPMLGDGGVLDAEVWRASVHDVEQTLEEQGGMILRRSGETGLPAEFVLRMPVGQTLELTLPDAFRTTDIFEGTSRAVVRRFYQLGGGKRMAPDRLRVRVVEACTPDLQVVQRTVLETAPFAILPVPLGFREQRWVQMIGCLPSTTVRESIASSRVRLDIPEEMPSAPLLRIERDGAIGVHESSLQAADRPLRFRIETICQFDAEQNRWEVLLQAPPSTPFIEVLPIPQTAEIRSRRVLAQLPGVALYWLRWSEEFGGTGATAPAPHQGFGFVGGMLCEDVDLAPAPSGRVATCVPYPDHAQASYVPDPIGACGPLPRSEERAGSLPSGTGTAGRRCGAGTCSEAGTYCQEEKFDVGAKRQRFSCLPAPPICGPRPTCACLGSVPCGGFCRDDPSGARVFCPEG
jgi:hypothetical protein